MFLTLLNFCIVKDTTSKVVQIEIKTPSFKTSCFDNTAKRAELTAIPFAVQRFFTFPRSTQQTSFLQVKTQCNAGLY